MDLSQKFPPKPPVVPVCGRLYSSSSFPAPAPARGREVGADKDCGPGWGCPRLLTPTCASAPDPCVSACRGVPGVRAPSQPPEQLTVCVSAPASAITCASELLNVRAEGNKPAWPRVCLGRRGEPTSETSQRASHSTRWENGPVPRTRKKPDGASHGHQAKAFWTQISPASPFRASEFS